jgi:hypothetical protein
MNAAAIRPVTITANNAKPKNLMIFMFIYLSSVIQMKFYFWKNPKKQAYSNLSH